MPKFTLDTNIFVDALRSSEGATSLKRFLATSLPATWMSAVVILELRAGAHTAAKIAALESGLIEPFARRNRILVPTARAYHDTGRVLAELTGDTRSGKRRRPTASFLTDVLLAVSCRENGVTLVTRDADFATIARHLPGLTFVPPWPLGCSPRVSDIPQPSDGRAHLAPVDLDRLTRQDYLQRAHRR